MAKKPLTIDELAFKYVYRDRRDKSGSILAKMKRRFGFEAAKDAIRRAEQAQKIIDPDWFDHHANEIFGSNPGLVIVDEIAQVKQNHWQVFVPSITRQPLP